MAIPGFRVLFALSSGLVGVITVIFVCVVALLFIHLPKLASRIRGTRGNDELFEKIYFSVSMSRIVTSVFLNTYLLSVLFGKGFLAFLPGRILSNLIMIPLLSIGTAVVLNVLGAESRSKSAT